MVDKDEVKRILELDPDDELVVGEGGGLKIMWAPGALELVRATFTEEEIGEMLAGLTAALDGDDSVGAEIRDVDLEQLAIDEPEVYKHMMAALDLLDEEETSYDFPPPPAAH